MVASVAIPTVSAFAAEEPTYDVREEYSRTDSDIPVKAGYTGTLDSTLYSTKADEIEEEIVDITKGNESIPRIYVEVEWDELKFIYDFGTVVDYEWDVDTLSYNPIYEYDFGNTEPGWNKDSAEIRFKNYSNRTVYCSAYFIPNEDTRVYDDVEFKTDQHEVILETAVGRDEDHLDQKGITFTIEGAPYDTLSPDYIPDLGTMYFALSETARYPEEHRHDVCNEDIEKDDGYYCSICGKLVREKGEHVCHFVYDQFGRLVCTGCNKVKHEYCIDEDEDGLCDECGLERDFCPDCHIGGTCKCT